MTECFGRWQWFALVVALSATFLVPCDRVGTLRGRRTFSCRDCFEPSWCNVWDRCWLSVYSIDIQVRKHEQFDVLGNVQDLSRDKFASLYPLGDLVP